jgi:hypothetical protein
MESRFKAAALFLTVCLLTSLLSQVQTHAFSLMGPFAPWMTPEVGFIRDEAWDIGGPRNLGDEFRWNVPVLTYGFDHNFKDFFGQPGIDAVEQAVAILNAVPPASQIDLLNVPLEAQRVHATAQAIGILDLKSFALVYLVEQLGLANAPGFVWNTTTTNVPAGVSEENGPQESLIQRNFDPITLTPSAYVNGARLTYGITDYSPGEFAAYFPQGSRIAFEYQIDQTEVFPAPVSATISAHSRGLRGGEYVVGLTRDDVGALKYLLTTNNINIEPTIPSVRAASSPTNFVNTAARPGVDKITLQRLDPGQTSFTNIFTDVYVENGQFKTQMLRRLVEAPDILFTAANHRRVGVPAFVRRTPPNFSHVNATGPGIFRPEVVISFHKLADIDREPLYQNRDFGVVIDQPWGSFDSNSATPTAIFPIGPAYEGGRTLSTRRLENPASIEWKLRLITGVRYTIESSTDLQSWTTLTNIVALPIHTLTNSLPNQPQTFYRVRRLK